MLRNTMWILWQVRQFSVEDLEMLSLCRSVFMPEHKHKHPVQAKEPESHYVLAKKQQSALPWSVWRVFNSLEHHYQNSWPAFANLNVRT